MQKYKRIQIFKRNVCVVQNVISYLFVRMQESIIKSIPASKNNSDAYITWENTWTYRKKELSKNTTDYIIDSTRNGQFSLRFT